MASFRCCVAAIAANLILFKVSPTCAFLSQRPNNYKPHLNLVPKAENVKRSREQLHRSSSEFRYHTPLSFPLFSAASRSSETSSVPDTESLTKPPKTITLATETVTLYPNTTKLRQLKDRMWVRETLEDLTSAEFACTLTLAPTTTQKQRRAVDFEALLQKLDRRIDEMCVVGDQGTDACLVLENEDRCLVLKGNGGMGSKVYTQEQRESLLERIVSTRLKLIKTMDGAIIAGSEGENLDEIRSKLQEKNLPSSEDSDDASTLFPKLYVRDDGTVDWDGALQDREALKLFGTSVWSRINGMDPDSVSEDSQSIQEQQHATTEKKVMATIVETAQIRALRDTLETLVKELADMEKENVALINSAIPPTTPNPTINLATLSAPLRAQIKESTITLSNKQDAVKIATLNYELERIFTYLEGELGNTFSKGYIPLQDRLTVAEFGLLESQIMALNEQMEEAIDSDVLQVIMEQMTEFKRRLGIDYYVNVKPTWDGEALKRWSRDLLEKSKEGLEFYVKGCKLFWNDLLFCSWLLKRAVQGYTLKPREVRTIRRTFRDIITFIPFIIILIIPLTPVGHVFVFGAIQRFFPDFFPSMFTERRQNLLQLYENAEYSEVTLNENFREKFLRFTEATVLMTANSIRNLYQKIGDANEEEEEDNK